MFAIEIAVSRTLALTEQDQSQLLDRLLAEFGRYPLPRFKLREFWLVDDVRRAGKASPEQWADLIALALHFVADDREIKELFGW